MQLGRKCHPLATKVCGYVSWTPAALFRICKTFQVKCVVCATMGNTTPRSTLADGKPATEMHDAVNRKVELAMEYQLLRWWVSGLWYCFAVVEERSMQ